MAGYGAALRPALDGLCAALTGAGVPAALNPGDVEGGGAWVTPRSGTVNRLNGAGEASVWVYLVTGDDDAGAAITALGKLLDLALPVLDVDSTAGDPIDFAVALALPSNPTYQLPACRIAVQLDIEQENTP